MGKGIIYVLLFGYALLDAQTVVNGATEGVQLALFAVLPSLFPFIFLSIMCSQSISGRHFFFLKPLEKLCGMPLGSGNILLLSLCGGYPVGAQCVTDAYKQGAISKKDAERLLGFCNNAGPSFIFGMVGAILKDFRLCWLLWFGQIISAITVGAIMPNKSKSLCPAQGGNSLSITKALESTLKISGKIAGWVLLFRVTLSVADKWILHRLTPIWSGAFSGALELSNGCIRLQYVSNPMVRFLLCGAILSFGGFCVYLQTKSVVQTLSTRYYLYGKVLQTVLILPILCFLWKLTVAF